MFDMLTQELVPELGMAVFPLTDPELRHRFTVVQVVRRHGVIRRFAASDGTDLRVVTRRSNGQWVTDGECRPFGTAWQLGN